MFRIFNNVSDFINKLRPRTKLIGTLLVGMAIILFFRSGENMPIATPTASTPLVKVEEAGRLAGVKSSELLATVFPLEQVDLTADTSGRVVRVNTKLGAKVAAGAVIVELENAAERAQVLQAEGAYEAALAAATTDSISLREAENNIVTVTKQARTTYSDSYTTVSTITRTIIDDFYANAESGFIGLRIDGKGMTTSLNSSRISLRTLLSAWQQDTERVAGAIEIQLETGIETTKSTIALIDSLIIAITNRDSGLSEEVSQEYVRDLNGGRTGLLAVITNLTSASAAIANAVEIRNRAEVAGSTRDGNVSAADAGVKQALGILRSAEANLAKTIIRTPIAGVVNTVAIRTGDYVSPGQRLAVIANNGGLELVSYLGESDRSRINIGMIVRLRNSSTTATVRDVSPAVDRATGKFEARLVVDQGSALTPGDVVQLIIDVIPTSETGILRLPLTAIKFNAGETTVFIVEDGKLRSLPVTIGEISNDTVEILSGIEPTTRIVTDVRGKSNGSSVTIVD